MRIIHTADIRLDRCYADQDLPPQVGRQNRAHLRALLESILARATAWPADAVVISGNLLEFERVERDTIGFLREAFARIAPVPVFICPGPRDPFVPTSPYATELWPENVHLFQEPTWTSVVMAGVTVWGFGYDGYEITKSPFDSLSDIPCDGPHMILGTTGDASEVARCGIDLDGLGLALAERPGLVYTALGGNHQAAPLAEAGQAVAWYSGAPEGNTFSETGPFHYLEITAEGDGAEVVQVPTSRGRFFRTTVDCTDLGSGQALIDVIRPLLAAEADCQCARVVLEGALLPSIYNEMASIRDTLAEDVLYLDLVDRCFAAENFGALANEKTSLGAFVARIGQEIEDAPDAHRHSALCRSRDLALCAYRGQHLPIRASQGD